MLFLDQTEGPSLKTGPVGPKTVFDGSKNG